MQGIRKCALWLTAVLGCGSVYAQADSLYTKACNPVTALSKKHCWFVGAGFGISTIKPEPVDNSLWRVDSTGDSAIKLYVGHVVSNHFFTEFSYENLGAATLKNLNPNISPGTDSIKYQAISLNAGYWLRGREKAWDIFAKVGLAHLITGGDDSYVFQDHAMQVAFSTGAELRFLNQWVGRLELSSYDKDASSFTLGISRHLGAKPKLKPQNKVTFKPKPKRKITLKPAPKVQPKPKAGPKPVVTYIAKPKPQPETVTPPKPIVPAKPQAVVSVAPKPKPSAPVQAIAPIPAAPKAPPVAEKKVVVIDDKDWSTKDRKLPQRTATRLLPRASDRDADGVKNGLDRCPKTPPETEVDESGCAILIHQVLSIKFDANRAVIHNRYADEIDKLANQIKTFGRVHIIVEAYSDRNDQEMDSQLLSELRAAVVADLLIIKTGIPNEGFTMIGRAEGNSDDAQRTQNYQSRQRVVVTVSRR